MRLTVLGCCGGIGGARRTMAEVSAACGTFQPQKLQQGQQFSF